MGERAVIGGVEHDYHTFALVFAPIGKHPRTGGLGRKHLKAAAGEHGMFRAQGGQPLQVLKVLGILIERAFRVAVASGEHGHARFRQRLLRALVNDGNARNREQQRKRLPECRRVPGREKSRRIVIVDENRHRERVQVVFHMPFQAVA